MKNISIYNSLLSTKNYAECFNIFDASTQITNIMVGIIIGFALAGLFFVFYNYLQKNNLKLKWFQWLSVFACVIFAAFTAMLIETFIQEGATKAALVMGSVFGIITLIWAILIIRLIIIKPLNAIDHEQ